MRVSHHLFPSSGGNPKVPLDCPVQVRIPVIHGVGGTDMVYSHVCACARTDGVARVRHGDIWLQGSGTYCFGPIEHVNRAICVKTRETVTLPIHLLGSYDVRVLTTLEENLSRDGCERSRVFILSEPQIPGGPYVMTIELCAPSG